MSRLGRFKDFHYWLAWLTIFYTFFFTNLIYYASEHNMGGLTAIIMFFLFGLSFTLLYLALVYAFYPEARPWS